MLMINGKYAQRYEEGYWSFGSFVVEYLDILNLAYTSAIHPLLVTSVLSKVQYTRVLPKEQSTTSIPGYKVASQPKYFAPKARHSIIYQ